MFPMPMSSPKMTRMFGLAASGVAASWAMTLPDDRARAVQSGRR